jgi:hypothetical protein
MRLALIAVAAAGLFAAGAAAAAETVTDVDFIKANRCRGLAQADPVNIDVAALDAFIKTQGRNRQTYILDKAAEEQARAKREAKTDNAVRKADMATELSGPCQRFKG